VSLYKYLPPERLDLLKDAKFRASRACDRNDPFDEFPAIKVDLSEATLRRRYEKEGIAATGHSFPDFVAAEHARSEEKSAASAEALRDMQSREFGAVCFSRVWDSIPMWSYYAEHHRGFVIGLNDKHPAFIEALGEPIPIIYGRRGLVRPREQHDAMDQIFTLKARDWAHEQESRCILRLQDCDPPVDADGECVVFRSYPREAVEVVYLGCQMDESLRDEIGQNFRAWGFAHSKLIQLDVHHEHFDFESRVVAI
jgi:hypothetical protein